MYFQCCRMQTLTWTLYVCIFILSDIQVCSNYQNIFILRNNADNIFADGWVSNLIYRPICHNDLLSIETYLIFETSLQCPLNEVLTQLITYQQKTPCPISHAELSCRSLQSLFYLSGEITALEIALVIKYCLYVYSGCGVSYHVLFCLYFVSIQLNKRLIWWVFNWIIHFLQSVGQVVSTMPAVTDSIFCGVLSVKLTVSARGKHGY